MYPNVMNLRAEWLLSVRAPLSSNETLSGGCLTAGVGGGGSSVGGSRPLAAHGTWLVCDLWKKNENLHGM